MPGFLNENGHDVVRPVKGKDLKIFLDEGDVRIEGGGLLVDETPSADNNLANKEYVDSEVAGAKAYADGAIEDAFVIASDSGAGANGSANGGLPAEIGVRAWAGANLYRSSNVYYIQPTEGSELMTNGDMSSPTGWTPGTGWNIADDVATHAPGSGSNLYQAVLSTYTWYKFLWEMVSVAAGGAYANLGGTSSPVKTAAGSYKYAGRAAGANAIITAQAAFDGVVDNVSVKAMTRSTMMATLPGPTSPEIDLAADISAVADLPAGLVVCVDNISNPANYLIVRHNGVNLRLDKVVAGVPTSLIDTAATFGAYSRLRIQTWYEKLNGLKVKCLIDGTQIGATQTVTDAGITGSAGNAHGLFSTDASNLFKNIELRRFMR